MIVHCKQSQLNWIISTIQFNESMADGPDTQMDMSRGIRIADRVSDVEAYGRECRDMNRPPFLDPGPLPVGADAIFR